MTLLELLVAARAARIELFRGTTGILRMRRPDDAAPLAGQLIGRKKDLLAVVDFYSGTTATLGWKTARTAPDGSTCVLCGGSTMLLDPYDGQPCHKTCYETAIAPGTTHPTTPARPG